MCATNRKFVLKWPTRQGGRLLRVNFVQNQHSHRSCCLLLPPLKHSKRLFFPEILSVRQSAAIQNDCEIWKVNMGERKESLVAQVNTRGGKLCVCYSRPIQPWCVIRVASNIRVITWNSFHVKDVPRVLMKEGNKNKDKRVKFCRPCRQLIGQTMRKKKAGCKDRCAWVRPYGHLHTDGVVFFFFLPPTQTKGGWLVDGR